MPFLKRIRIVMAGLLAVLMLCLQFASQSHAHSHDLTDPHTDHHHVSDLLSAPVFSDGFGSAHRDEHKPHGTPSPSDHVPEHAICGLCIVASLEEDDLSDSDGSDLSLWALVGPGAHDPRHDAISGQELPSVSGAYDADRVATDPARAPPL